MQAACNNVDTKISSRIIGLWTFSAKTCRPLGCLPNKSLITKAMRERQRVVISFIQGPAEDPDFITSKPVWAVRSTLSICNGCKGNKKLCMKTGGDTCRKGILKKSHWQKPEVIKAFGELHLTASLNPLSLGERRYELVEQMSLLVLLGAWLWWKRLILSRGY